MIQRIQSIYFLLAGMIPAFTFCLPMFGFDNAEHSFAMTACGIYGKAGETLSHPWGVIVFSVLCIALPLFAIFKYRNRMLQIKLANVQIICLLLLFLTAGTYAYAFACHKEVSIQLDWGGLFPLLSLLFTILGRRAVRHDEALVRAADRIR